MLLFKFLVFLAVVPLLQAAQVRFDFQYFTTAPVTNRLFRVRPIALAAGTNGGIAVTEWLSYNSGSNGVLMISNMVAATYQCDLLGAYGPVSFKIAVPNNTNVYNASALSTNVVGASSTPFVLRENGTATNLTVLGPLTLGGVPRTDWPTGGTGGSALETNADQFGESVVLTVKKLPMFTNVQAYLGDGTGRAITAYGDIWMDTGFHIYGNGEGLTDLNGVSIKPLTISTSALDAASHALYIAGAASTNEWSTNIARTVFVATNGSDTWPGTFLFPKASLSNALEMYTSNYTVHMQPGLYTMVGRANAAVSGNPCSIPCEGKQQLIIDGPGAKMYWPDGLLSGLLIHNCTNVLVKNIEMRGNRTNWMMPPAWASNNVQSLGVYAIIEVGDSAHIKFDSITLRDGWNHGLMLDAPQYRSTYRCTNGIVIINSTFRNFGLLRLINEPPGVFTYDGSGCAVSGGALVAHNTFENCSSGIELYPLDTIAYDENLPKTLILGNIVKDSRAAGLNIQGGGTIIVGNKVTYDSSNTNHWTNLIWQTQCGIYLQGSKSAVVANNEFDGYLYGMLVGVNPNITVANNFFGRGSIVQMQGANGVRFVGNNLLSFTNDLRLIDIRDSDISGNVMRNVGTNPVTCYGNIMLVGIISNVTMNGNVVVNDNYTFWGIWADPGATINKLRLLDNTGLVGSSGTYYLPAGALSEFRELQGVLMDTLTGAETNVQLRGSLGPVGLSFGGTLRATSGVATASITFPSGHTQTNAVTNTTVAAGANVTATTNITGTNTIYTLSSTDVMGYRGPFWTWGGTNVLWRLVKNITLTNTTDVSACAYFPSNRSIFTVHNTAGGKISEWTLDGIQLRAITNPVPAQVPDCESITWMGGTEFAVVDEDNNRIFKLNITNNTIGWVTNESTIVQLHASIGVDGGTPSGVEGLAWDVDRDGWWIVREKGPAQLMFVSADGAVTNNWFTTAQMQTFTNAVNTDFSDIFFDRQHQMLWVTQDEASQNDRVLGISLRTSNVVVTLNVTNFGQLEGVSITEDGKLLLAGEVNQFAIFEPYLGGLNGGIVWVQPATNALSVPVFPNGVAIGTNSTSNAKVDIVGDNSVLPILRIGTTNRPGMLSFNTNGVLSVPAGSSASNAVVGGVIAFSTAQYTNFVTPDTLTNMAAATIAAHTLTNNGDTISWEGSGMMRNATCTTNRIYVQYGATAILDTGTQTASNTAWRAWGTIVRTGNSSQYATGTLLWDGAAPFKSTNVALSMAENNGISRDFVFRCATKANTMALTQMWFSVSYVPASK